MDVKLSEKDVDVILLALVNYQRSATPGVAAACQALADDLINMLAYYRESDAGDSVCDGMWVAS